MQILGRGSDADARPVLCRVGLDLLFDLLSKTPGTVTVVVLSTEYFVTVTVTQLPGGHGRRRGCGARPGLNFRVSQGGML